MFAWVGMRSLMVENRFVVYSPPTDGYPYLAAMILPMGRVEVEPFATAAQAELHNRTAKLLMDRAIRPAPALEPLAIKVP